MAVTPYTSCSLQHPLLLSGVQAVPNSNRLQIKLIIVVLTVPAYNRKPVAST